MYESRMSANERKRTWIHSLSSECTSRKKEVFIPGCLCNLSTRQIASFFQRFFLIARLCSFAIVRPRQLEFYFACLLQIISVTVITLVACMLSDKTYLVSIAEEGNNYEAGLYILLCTGILMLIVSILGWCSAFKHSRYCLATFFSIMLVIVVAQVAFAGWLYAHKDRLDELVRSSVINTVKVIPFLIMKLNYYIPNPTTIYARDDSWM